MNRLLQRLAFINIPLEYPKLSTKRKTCFLEENKTKAEEAYNQKFGANHLRACTTSSHSEQIKSNHN
jgi:hypothetical protein